MTKMTKSGSSVVRTREDLPVGHWMARQLPEGASLRGYAEDRAISVLTQVAQEAIDGAGISRAEVAELLGTSRSYVSQVLNGSTNMTLKTLGALLWVAGQQVARLETEPVAIGQQDKHRCARVLRLPFTSPPDEYQDLVISSNVRKAG